MKKFFGLIRTIRDDSTVEFKVKSAEFEKTPEYKIFTDKKGRRRTTVKWFGSEAEAKTELVSDRDCYLGDGGYSLYKKTSQFDRYLNKNLNNYGGWLRSYGPYEKEKKEFYEKRRAKRKKK